MENYTLYFKIVNQNVTFQKVVTLMIPEDKNIEPIELLNIANKHLSGIGIMVGIMGPNSEGNMESRTIPMRMGKVEVWQYFEKYNGFIGFADVLNNPLPMELKVIVYVKEGF